MGMGSCLEKKYHMLIKGSFYSRVAYGEVEITYLEPSKYSSKRFVGRLAGGYPSEGEGLYITKNGTVLEGVWENKIGKGTINHQDGRSYSGEFFMDMFHGKGVLTNPNGEEIKGEFKYGQPFNAKGIFFGNNYKKCRDIYYMTGKWVNGIRNIKYKKLRGNHLVEEEYSVGKLGSGDYEDRKLITALDGVVSDK